jgi:phytoene dehydrogenase-like protein
MTTRYYDVIVLGRSLGALATAVLLARRDFRVLVLGQDGKPCDYRFDRFRFRRRAFTWLAGASPPWLRLLQELAQTPRFRRRLISLDPMFSAVLPSQRLELPPDIDLFYGEIEREFPEVRQIVDELYASFAGVNAAADDAFDRNVVWPPGNVWERFQTNRVASRLPLVGSQEGTDILSRFPAGHQFRDLVWLPAEFASHMAAPSSGGLPPFALARLHGAWARGIHALQRGEDELTEFLVERIEAHSGLCRLDSRASKIIIERGSVSAIVEEGEEHAVGTANLVTDLPGEVIAELAGGQGITASAQRQWPRLVPSSSRYVVSLLLNKAGLPEPLAEESFLVSPRLPRLDPRRPDIHLQRFDLSRLDDAVPTSSTDALVVAEILLPRRGILTLYEAREAVLATLRSNFPFLDRHLIAVDSPHDGLPLWDYSSGSRVEVDRVHCKETAPGGEPMSQLWNAQPAGFLGLAGEPLRGPIAGTYLTGSTVLPALGQEGELLAASSVARLITRKHGTRQRMRRQMWSRVESD